jgi:hypothetical protein
LTLDRTGAAKAAGDSGSKRSQLNPSIGKGVPSRESRAKLAARRETTAVERMVKKQRDKVVKTAVRQQSWQVLEVHMKTSAFILVRRPRSGLVARFVGQQTNSRFRKVQEASSCRGITNTTLMRERG